MRVLGSPSGQEGVESSRRERLAPVPGRAWGAVPAVSGVRAPCGGPAAGQGRAQGGHPAPAPAAALAGGAEPCPPHRDGAAVPGSCPRPVAVQRKPAAIHRAPGKEAFTALHQFWGSSEALEAGIGSLPLEINLFRVKLEASREDTEFSTIAGLLQFCYLQTCSSHQEIAAEI